MNRNKGSKLRSSTMAWRQRRNLIRCRQLHEVGQRPLPRRQVLNPARWIGDPRTRSGCGRSDAAAGPGQATVTSPDRDAGFPAGAGGRVARAAPLAVLDRSL